MILLSDDDDAFGGRFRSTMMSDDVAWDGRGYTCLTKKNSFNRLVN